MSGDLARDDVTPYPKAIQTATRTKKHRRPRATSGKWAGIAAEKNGPCVICKTAGPNDLHHIMPRDRGGVDEAWNIAPLCRHDHQLIELRDHPTCVAFVRALWERGTAGPRGGVSDEYSAVTDVYGEDVWERVYGVYERRTA